MLVLNSARVVSAQTIVEEFQEQLFWPTLYRVNYDCKQIYKHTLTVAGSNYTKLYQLQLHLIFNYNYSHNCPNQLQLHCFNYNYIMRNQIYSAFVNYVFLHVLLNLNIFYTIDKQI